MTVRHLLTHTSGLPDYYDALAEPRGRRVRHQTPTRSLAGREGRPPVPPGEKFQYSDAGYEMLALVLERAAGRPFGDLLRERISRRPDARHLASGSPTSRFRTPRLYAAREGFVAEGITASIAGGERPSTPHQGSRPLGPALATTSW